MKTEKYIVEIEMPDGDFASPTWVQDTLQAEADVEDEGRWKVSVNKQHPREGLVDIDKAYKWLDAHILDYIYAKEWGQGVGVRGEFFEDFRKAMEE